jgi:hypothetical protein
VAIYHRLQPVVWVVAARQGQGVLVTFGKRFAALASVTALATALAGCATQQAMTVDAVPRVTAPAKYRNAMAVRSVAGGQQMNILTVPGVADEPFKAALEGSLGVNGYLAQTGPAKYSIDAVIQNLQQPLVGLDMDVTATVTYTVSGGGKTETYPISATATAALSDSLIGADRIRVANERAMKENIRKFLQALR